MGITIIGLIAIALCIIPFVLVHSERYRRGEERERDLHERVRELPAVDGHRILPFQGKRRGRARGDEPADDQPRAEPARPLRGGRG